MSGRAYYNEFDPYAAEWLRNLVSEKLITDGRVDGRPIEAVRANELEGYERAHFFAGVAGWERALELAEWPRGREIWTGSCPCQPFSSAGSRAGFDDARHVWPAWFGLIRERRPSTIVGEQVASSDGLDWLDLVFADLESEGYQVGAADLCAASVGAPHRRQRFFFVAHAHDSGRKFKRAARLHAEGAPGDNAIRRGAGGGVGDAGGNRDREHAGELPGDEGEHEERPTNGDHPPEPSSAPDGLALAPGFRLEGRLPEPSGAIRIRETDLRSDGGAVRGFWSGADWLVCRDGTVRPVEPGTFPLAHGLPERVGQLRAWGNAIAPPVAAVFLRAVLSIT